MQVSFQQKRKPRNVSIDREGHGKHLPFTNSFDSIFQGCDVEIRHHPLSLLERFQNGCTRSYRPSPDMPFAT
jgi:hypothetical protein